MSTQNIEKNFTEIANILLALLAAEEQTAETRLLKTQLESLQQQYAQIAELFSTFTIEQLTYEFFEQASDVIEYITDLRLVDPLYRQELNNSGIYALLNKLVNTLKKMIYLHPAIANQYHEEQKPAGETLETIQKYAEDAAKHAMEAARAAEKANREGTKYLDKIQKDQQKSGGLIDQKLMQDSFQHTLSMYATNAAAVIAADEATAAMVLLEQSLEANE
jgi:hypothetical protein